MSCSKTELVLLLATGAIALVAACSPDLNERRVSCPETDAVATVHSWADRVVIRPGTGHQWYDLMKEPLREYGLPPINEQTLQRRYRESLRSATEGDQEYALSDGVLRLSLDRDRSGSAVHETWRLRFKPRRSLAPSGAVIDEVLVCSAELRDDDYDLVLLDGESGRAKVSITVESGLVQRLTWMNLTE
jgi:hypothetical protein